MITTDREDRPQPRHLRMITAIRRMPAPDHGLAAARREADRINDLIAARDWHKWRNRAKALGVRK